MGIGCECAKRSDVSPPQSSVSIETPREVESRAAVPSGRRDQKEKRVGEREAESESASPPEEGMDEAPHASRASMLVVRGTGMEAACGNRPAGAVCSERGHM